jgi:hypothetical protein
VITAAPDAGGPLSFRNCPTLDEARAAVPAVVRVGEVNAVLFKTMVLQCNYVLPGVDLQGRPNGISILVFDAAAEGSQLWSAVRGTAAFPNPTDIPGLAEIAFATGSADGRDLWVVEGAFGFHLSSVAGVPLDELVALGRSMLSGLRRPPR